MPPYFWHRTRGFLKARCSWEPGSRLTTGDLSPFRLLPKVSGANVLWANANYTFLAHKNLQADTFSREISPAKLCSTAQVRNPKGISKLMNKVDCCMSYDSFLALCSRQQYGPSSLWNPSQQDPQCTPAIWHASQSQSQGTSYLQATVIPNGTETLWMWRAIVGADHSASLSCIFQGQVQKVVLLWYYFCMWLPRRKGT